MAETKQVMARVVAKAEKTDKNGEYYWQYELQAEGQSRPLTYRDFDNWEAGKEVRSGQVWQFAVKESTGEKGNTFRNITSVIERMDDDALGTDVEAPRIPGEASSTPETPPWRLPHRETLIARESALKSAVDWCGACVRGGVLILEDGEERPCRTADVIRVADVFLSFIEARYLPGGVASDRNFEAWVRQETSNDDEG